MKLIVDNYCHLSVLDYGQHALKKREIFLYLTRNYKPGQDVYENVTDPKTDKNVLKVKFKQFVKENLGHEITVLFIPKKEYCAVTFSLELFDEDRLLDVRRKLIDCFDLIETMVLEKAPDPEKMINPFNNDPLKEVVKGQYDLNK